MVLATGEFVLIVVVVYLVPHAVVAVLDPEQSLPKITLARGASASHQGRWNWRQTNAII